LYGIKNPEGKRVSNKNNTLESKYLSTGAMEKQKNNFFLITVELIILT
jgi:hypothetical protein